MLNNKRYKNLLWLCYFSVFYSLEERYSWSISKHLFYKKDVFKANIRTLQTMSSIILKTHEEIDKMRVACSVLSQMLGYVGSRITPGVSLRELDNLAETFILDHGCLPACKGYGGFPATLCLSVNDKVVHGIPNNYVLKEGDIISVDSCVQYEGFIGDCTYTFGVGEISEQDKRLINVTKQSLYEGIKMFKSGNRLGDISSAIENYVNSNGFHIVKKFCGHGIGRDMHEAPRVLNYGSPRTGIALVNGLALAIEPIVGATTGLSKTLNNGWDEVMVNGCNAAHFEHTVVLLDNKTEILTTYKYCEDNTHLQ
ncbi:MAG: type I methionyl aminopeptidase [Cytophagales bacterium]|nr:type I methionyl aminopeptidase [Cytophagales bacterium]